PRLQELQERNKQDPTAGEQLPLFYWPLQDEWESSQGKHQIYDHYEDPFGGDYQGRWLAAVDSVIVKKPETDSEGIERVVDWNPGWVVIVQERYQEATDPV